MVVISETYPQPSALKIDFHLHFPSDVYSEYFGVSLGGVIPVFENKLYIGPQIKYYSTRINTFYEFTNKQAFNRALSLGMRGYYFPVEKFSFDIFNCHPFIGGGIEYQFNHIGSTTNFAYDITNTLIFDDLKKDFIPELFVGLKIIPPPGVLQFNIESEYQFRNPMLLYTRNQGSNTTNYEKKVNLNAFLLKLGIQLTL